MLAYPFMLKKFIAWLEAHWCQSQPIPEGNPMAVIDGSGIAALIDVLAADIQKISAELSGATAVHAALDAEKAAHAADKAALDQADADLAASQALVADLQAKFKAQTDAISALLPPAA